MENTDQSSVYIYPSKGNEKKSGSSHKNVLRKIGIPKRIKKNIEKKILEKYNDRLQFS